MFMPLHRDQPFARLPDFFFPRVVWCWVYQNLVFCRFFALQYIIYVTVDSWFCQSSLFPSVDTWYVGDSTFEFVKKMGEADAGKVWICGYLWPRGVIQLKKNSISIVAFVGSKFELQRPLNVLNFFRTIVRCPSQFTKVSGSKRPSTHQVPFRSISKKYCQDLENLLETLNTCHLHYIRCLEEDDWHSGILGRAWGRKLNSGCMYLRDIQVKLIWMSVQHLGSDALSMVQANLQVASSRMSAKNQPFSTRLWSWISWCSLLAWLGLRWEVGLVA